jgi:hypothetical protein
MGKRERVDRIDEAAIVSVATTETVGERPGLRVGLARLAWFRV